MDMADIENLERDLGVELPLGLTLYAPRHASPRHLGREPHAPLLPPLLPSPPPASRSNTHHSPPANRRPPPLSFMEQAGGGGIWFYEKEMLPAESLAKRSSELDSGCVPFASDVDSNL